MTRSGRNGATAQRQIGGEGEKGKLNKYLQLEFPQYHQDQSLR